MTTFDASTTENLIRALRNGDHQVRCKAAEQAGRRREHAAVPTLVELLYETGPDSKSLITVVASALGEIGDLRAMQHLGEARYAHSYSAGLPGFKTYTADGRVIEAGEQDVLMDEAIDEAEQNLWNQPGAPEYVAQLGKIRMYTFGDFWRSNDIHIDEDIQKQLQYPFTMPCAQRFFANFKRERFAFEGEIRSIFIRRGKEALPRNSFADGGLYPQTLDEISQLGQAALDPVGEIHFEFGGNATAPYVVVRPEPHWPRPSIVRRCVLDGRTGIRFEEIT
jgi:hypothetical protein